MTEQEKMLAGKIYDPADETLAKLRTRAHELCLKYNQCLESDPKRAEILKELLPNMGEKVYLQGPVQFDYGCFTTMGKGCYANFNFTCLDCAPVTIKDNCWIAGNVTICGGVTIGSGSVIGAGSVVTRDIPDNVIAAGVPCKVIREITETDSLENHPELQ